jgi:hypothetical protein
MFQRESHKKAIDRSKVQKESFGVQNRKSRAENCGSLDWRQLNSLWRHR